MAKIVKKKKKTSKKYNNMEGAMITLPKKEIMILHKFVKYHYTFSPFFAEKG